MKTAIRIRSLALISSLAAIVPLATAQVAQNAATAASTNAAQSANAATTAAQGAVSGAVQPPVAPPVAGSVAAGVQSNANGSPQTGVNAQAETHASATGQARGLGVAGIASSQEMNMNANETVREIHGATIATRDGVAAKIQSQLDTSAERIADLRARADRAGEKSRAALAWALADVRAREKDLRASLRNATLAAGESSWGEAQSALARDYGAYAQAVASAEAAVQTGAETP